MQIPFPGILSLQLQMKASEKQVAVVNTEAVSNINTLLQAEPITDAATSF